MMGTAVTSRLSLRESLAAFGVFLALALVLHFPHYGSHYGDPNFDFYLHYHWAREFADGVSHGWLYPRCTRCTPPSNFSRAQGASPGPGARLALTATWTSL